jgi:hypothetical protein
MKVTIISNGQQQLVLKPENKLEAITLEQLNDKTLTATHFDKPTQILNESYPDCLVLSKTGKFQNTIWGAVIDCNNQNSILGLIPSTTTQEDILDFIKVKSNSAKAELEDRTSSIKLDETFKVKLTIMVDEQSSSIIDNEYAVVLVDTYTKW